MGCDEMRDGPRDAVSPGRSQRPPQLTRLEVPHREVGLTIYDLIVNWNIDQISGCLPGAPPPASALESRPATGGTNGHSEPLEYSLQRSGAMPTSLGSRLHIRPDQMTR